MSAYFVEPATVTAILAAALGRTEPNHIGNAAANPLRWWDGTEPHTLSQGTATEIGRMLLQENLYSMEARYDLSESEADEYRLAITLYEYPQGGWIYKLTAGDVLGAIHCYEYQACEHEGWHESSAKALCQSLKERMLTELAGDGGWGMNERDLGARRTGARSLLSMLP